MSRSKALWIEEALAPQMEGKLYEHIWVTIIGDQYSVCKDFYTVQKGEVYMVNDGTKQPTEDTLEDTNNQCILIGDYDPGKVYTRKIVYYSRLDFKKLLNLD